MTANPPHLGGDGAERDRAAADEERDELALELRGGPEEGAPLPAPAPDLRDLLP